jgi:thioredoxin reductase
MMSTRYDFVIVGAGTAGLPAAVFASRRGAVLLIDAAEDIGGTLHLVARSVRVAPKLQAARHPGLAGCALRGRSCSFRRARGSQRRANDGG